MGLATIACRTQLGLQAPLVQVEVSLDSGLPVFAIVGLPATVVKESKERVRAALLNSGFDFPAGRITINLSPADLPKQGGRFDLPIALGILIASRQLGSARGPISDRCVEFYGELGLSGELKPVPGLLLAAGHAASAGHEVIIPGANLPEMSLLQQCLGADRVRARAAGHLREVCAHVEGTRRLTLLIVTDAVAASGDGPPMDLADVRGHLQVKRALAIAASGAHSILMIGPPGSGKSMLAQRVPGLLPALTDAEALEVATINSASLSAAFDVERFGRRPFRAPHHTASAAALVGGGPRARPGEISLAHRGVLFLDELPEFDRRVLEALREPLETGLVSVARAAVQVTYPAECMVIAALNPCPCGFFGDDRGTCRCTPNEIRRYRSRISGPLLDRLDMHVSVPRLAADEFHEDVPRGDSTREVAARVSCTRSVQLARQGKCNARLNTAEVEKWCRLDTASQALLERAMKQLHLSARGRERVLKLARTIADLSGEAAITSMHIAEALQFRALDGGPP
ncbi:MAG TPA: YifB family Mg chelatase-like AAA ATPase [Steroidobacteraceae bacterium]|nr:YifB family Mg chelatase-like AAA ATPase [Steroidobacteraceae bacterium]